MNPSENVNVKVESGKYTVLHAGKALNDFLNRVTITETRIGEFSSSKPFDRAGTSKNYDLICSGHMVSNHEEVSWIYTGIDTPLDANPKFKRAFDRNPVQILKQYYDDTGLSEEDLNESINKITKLNNNKMLIVPFKLGTSCTVEIEVESHTFVKDMELDTIKWVTDKESSKLKCMLIFKNANVMSGRSYSLPITSYLDKFRVSSISIQGKVSKNDTDIIKATDNGVFRPIQFSDGDSSVVIDGSYVYFISGAGTVIIGEWKNDDLVIYNTLKNKAFKAMMKRKDAIRAHRRYIAPYSLVDTVEIKI